MLGAMLHPANKPKIENGIVTEGYAIMQPRMDTTVESASKTLFSVMITGSGGIDIYASAAFDIYQTIYGEGIFCGKGIFDVSAFHTLLDEAFPCDSVLSHDLLEGTRLRAAYLSDVSLTDSCPKNPLSYFGRLHRWIRGDVQAADFGGRYITDFHGKRVKNPITALSKYKLFDNIRRILTPISVVIALVCALFTPKPQTFIVFAAAFSYLLFPFVISFRAAAVNIARRFYSFVVQGIWRTFCITLYNIASLVYLSFISSDAVIRSFVRIKFTHKHTLEWVTASESDSIKLDGAVLYIVKMLSSVIAGLLFFIFSPYGIYKILGLLWIAFPLISYYSGHESKKAAFTKSNRMLSDTHKETIKKYAADTWRYYNELVTEDENYLPPDNYQISPVETVAHRTSPTNIGLYMLSCLAAFDFAFIDAQTLKKRLTDTLSTIENLIKWNGHLYNWYDTLTLNVLGSPYISTVDSGNFITSLVTLKEGLRKVTCDENDEKFDDVIGSLDKLIAEADFKSLYCEKRDLFYIGYDIVNKTYGSNCYDLFMSESRTTSYYAIARGDVPKRHWAKLGRTLITKDGYIGLISWTGTMFEYFMPPLLLPTYENSLLYEALNFAVRMQIENRCGESRLWGKSESAYFAFDADMNYQYKAFGIQKLGLKVGLNLERVLSPYSSFLALGIRNKAALANLKRFEDFGMYGKYGFYEAADFTHTRVGNGNAVIHSFMAHHVGMSIIAAGNAYFDNIFNKRFMADPQMASAKELLQEKIPVDAVIYKNNVTGKLNPPSHYNSRNNLNRIFHAGNAEYGVNSPKTAVISNNKTKITASALGNIYLSDGKIALTNPCFTINPNTANERLKTLKLLFKIGDKVYDIASYAFSYAADSICYSVDLPDENLKASAYFTVYGSASCVNISLSVEGKFTDICPLLIFEPVLANPRDFIAHPAFSNLSLESDYLKDEKILLFSRKPRMEKESEQWLAVTLESSGGNIDFETRKDTLYPLMYDESDIAACFDKNFTRETGACINPICAVKKASQTKNGKYECDFLISYSKSKTEAIEIIKNIRAKKKGRFKNDFKQSLAKIAENQIVISNINFDDIYFPELITSCIFHRLNDENTLTETAEPSVLWKYGISGDLPIICCNISSGGQTDSGDRREYKSGDKNNIARIIKNFINTHRYLMIKGVRFDLVIIYSDVVKYNQPVKNFLHAIIRNCGSEFLLNQKGGIYLVNKPTDIDVFHSISNFYAKIEENTVFANIYHEYMLADKFNGLSSRAVTKIQSKLNDNRLGYFTDDSFVVIKGGQKAPWCHIYCNDTFGTMVSQNSLGFTWTENSREKRLTPWSNDIMLDNNGERIILTYDKTDYDLCAVSHTAEFRRGCVVYSGQIGDLRYQVSAGVDKMLSVKVISVELSEPCEVRYELIPCLGTTAEYPNLIKKTAEGNGDKTVLYNNYYTSDFNKTVFTNRAVSSDNKNYMFTLGVIYNAVIDTAYDMIRDKYTTPTDAETCFTDYGEYMNDFFGKIQIKTDYEYLDRMINFYLPHQSVFTRMAAKTGFYQSSGAVGFRDQLQDSLTALYFDASITRNHILLCASRQYVQGDVQHWWHNTKGNPGVRTRCSDDYLWLAYVTAAYIEYTGDYDILEEKAAYLESEPLADDEQERYEIAAAAVHEENIYMHCVRAIENGFKFGDHGLPLIGSCDWNDGFSRVGSKGIGESVWLAWFLKIVLKKFIPICEMKCDFDGAEKYRSVIAELGENIEKNCWDGNWYLRAFTDNGKKLGADGNAECKIDVLPQAFAAISEGPNERVKTALDNAYMYLYDSKFKLYKLFTPAFYMSAKERASIGYIDGYVSGVRENGGQYSHAAIWACIGYLRAGEYERGFEILNAINPAARLGDTELMDVYRIEPYVFAGDVYTNAEHYGRGGWSHYTGAAGWYFKAVIEELIGYKVRGDHFTLNPRLSDKFHGFTLYINERGTKYTVEVKRGNENLLMLDGKIVNNKFYFDKLNHFLKITVEKKS
jgi:cyclic beta-1,2-glucan synthetase